MAFTDVTLTHSWPSSTGTVTFTLTQTMANDEMTYQAGYSVAGTLDEQGNLSVSLPANTDPATLPAAPLNAAYLVTIRIAAVAPETYTVTVPADQGDNFDLWILIPTEQQVG